MTNAFDDILGKRLALARVKSRRTASALAVAALAAVLIPAATANARHTQLADYPLVPNLRLIGAGIDDLTGESVSAAGDVNGDGLADVIVGAPAADRNGRSTSGTAYVVFGRPWRSTVRLGRLGPTGQQIAGAAAGDRAGTAVAAAGDVNGDRRTDVVVGAPEAGGGGRPGAGSAYVIFGAPGPTAIDLGDLGPRGFRVDGAKGRAAGGSNGDEAGGSVGGVGDANRDGLDDVIVGAQWADPRGRRNAGSAYVVFGKPGFEPVDLGALAGRGFAINGARGDGAAGRAQGDQAGASVGGAGDVNADGRPDVVVGAPMADLGRQGTEPGAAYVIFSGGTARAVDLRRLGSRGFAIGSGRGHFHETLGAIGEQAGASVAGAGDVNGDGRADVLVGAPQRITATGASGAAFVIFGKRGRRAVNLSRSLRSRGLRIAGALELDAAGGAVAGAGDVNGDGLPDVVAGAPLAADRRTRRRPASWPRSGAGYVFFAPGVRTEPRMSFREGAIYTRLSCLFPRPRGCQGTLTIRAAETIRCGGDSRRRLSVIGRRSFRLAPRGRQRLRVPLTAEDRRLVDCVGSLRVQANTRYRAVAGAAARSVLVVRGTLR